MVLRAGQAHGRTDGGAVLPLGRRFEDDWLRFSNVVEPHDYASFPSFDVDPRARAFNLWAYIDARDGAQAVRLALEHPKKGLEIFIIANSNTVMSRPNAELLAEVFPTTPIKRAFGANETLLSIEKAKRLLDYAPKYDWRPTGA